MISSESTSRKLFFRCALDRVEPVGLEPEQVPRLQHMRRQRRGGIDHPAARMRNHDPPREGELQRLHGFIARELRRGSGKIVAIVSGGNIDLDKFAQLVA